MENLKKSGKRKNNPTKSNRPLKKKKLVNNDKNDMNDSNDINAFLDDDIDDDIDDIINEVIEEEKDLHHDDAEEVEEEEEEDIDLATTATYNELDEFHANDFESDELEPDEFDFDEVSNNKSNNNNDDFLELGSDDDDDENDDVDTKTAKPTKDRADHEIDGNVETEKIDFIFPSYKRLLKEKNEAPNLSELKTRIENVLSILSNFSTLRDDKHCRKEYISLLSHSLSRYYGYNLDLMNMFLTLFNPNECLAFLESNEHSRPLTIRTNTLKCRRRDLAKLLIDRGVNLDPLAKWTKTGLKILNQDGNINNIPIGATPEYLSGYYMIQSAASLLPTLAMSLSGNQKVLDMCCAPGGKTSHIAQILRNTGVVIANDINNERLKAVYGNIHRMGLKNVIITNIDARLLSQHFHPIFDRVLLDAPCSCLGVISRDPSIKFSKKFNDVIKMSTLQKELILTAIDCCKVGGYIIYSTCSISPYENESVIYHAIQNRYVKIVETGLEFGEKGFTKFKHLKFNKQLTKTKRYYPHIHNLDGFYVAKLLKCDKGKRGNKLTKN